MSIKAALVDTQTDIVTNIIIVNSIADPVPANFKLVEIDQVPQILTDRDHKLINVMMKNDPTYSPPLAMMERPIILGTTMWSEDLGFHDEKPTSTVPISDSVLDDTQN